MVRKILKYIFLLRILSYICKRKNMKKVKMNIKDLPILGNAQIPIRLMQYSHKKDKSKFFQSGFAYFGVADDQADVTGPNGESKGSLGGKMGGNYEINQKREEDNITLIIDVEDLWDQIGKLLETAGVKVQLEGIEETYKKYWTKHEKLKEISQMQKEAEKEEKKKEIEKVAKASKKKEEESKKAKEESLKIIDNNGWDLDKEISDYDYHFDEDFRIPADIGVGVKVIKDGVPYTSKHRETPTVTLVITTWKGTGAVGAIHYYGELKIGLPQFCMDSQPICLLCGIFLYLKTQELI